MKRDCKYGLKGLHECRVVGTPRSEMTWYECRLCGKREARGAGLFYKPTVSVQRQDIQPNDNNKV